MTTEIKTVLVGDGSVGKTSLLVTYTKNEFPSGYVPTIFDNYEARLTVEGEELTLSLWDTAGQEGYQRIRVLSYPKTNVFILCFALNNKTSCDNITEKWLPELRHHCPDIPVILAGTKSDLRRDNHDESVSKAQGQAMARAIGAVAYIETSAKKRENVKFVFDTAVSTVYHAAKNPSQTAPTKKRRCIIC
eukprot:TRINITY_DN1188_c0_g1_i1.p1 TRINITY_DN1188_c0_g1~~TRINITY_DN1188_c0_g1_i1.p1  ORF type:complete len:190 (-),score=25.35 TRINITY_DN1188_c0_g1_i1:53-622(-)